MSLVLKAYVLNHLTPIPSEEFEHYRAARVRAAALLRSGMAGADTIAICPTAEGGGEKHALACLTLNHDPGTRPTEWPGVWEDGMPVSQAEEEAEAAWGSPAGRLRAAALPF